VFPAIDGKEVSPGRDHIVEKKKVVSCSGVCEIKFEDTKNLTGGKDLVSTMGGMAGLTFLGFLLGMLGIGLGYPGVPYIVNRYMAAKGPREIARGKVVAMTWGVLAFWGAITMGMCARVLFPDIADPEESILSAAEAFLHPALAGLILAAVISAIRSTADSQLLVAASCVTRDFYEKTLDKHVSDKKLLTMSRITVIIVGVAATVIALMEVPVIFWFVLFAWAGLGAAFGPPLILSVYWKGLTKAGVLAGMLTGFGMTLLWKLWLLGALKDATGFELYELFPGFFCALAATVLVSLYTKKPEQAHEFTDELSRPWHETEG
jgi:Na+/proline symporter